MAIDITNLGIATPKVELVGDLPNWGGMYNKTNFDVSAHNFNEINNSPYFPPLLTECMVDPEGTIAACFPAKRHFWIPNFMEGSSEAGSYTGEDPYITWRPLDKGAADGSIVEKIIPKYLPYTLINESAGYTVVSPVETNPEQVGPSWKDLDMTGMKTTDDEVIIANFYSSLSLPPPVPPSDSTTATPPLSTTNPQDVDVPSTPSILQEDVKDGLWWGIESSPFLQENMPFWIQINRTVAPTTKNYDSILVISLGLTDTKNRFDIYLSSNNVPRLFDYLPGSNNATVDKPWDSDKSRVLHTNRNIEIEVMVIAGRLVIAVNKEVMVYNRINRGQDGAGDSVGALFEAKIAKGPIRIWGFNVSGTFNVHPMCFAPQALMALPIPVIVTPPGPSTTISDAAAAGYTGMSNTGEANTSPIYLTTQPGSNKLRYGCDCRTFKDNEATIKPDPTRSDYLQCKGYILFKPANNTPGSLSAMPNLNFYLLGMLPENSTINDKIIPNGRCPFFFRLAGINITNKPIPTAATPGDVSNYVISVDETCTAPDYFHVRRSISITFYDPAAVISGQIIAKQTGVKLSWGWNGSVLQSFIGLSTNISTTLVAGKETCTVTFEDYTFILKNTPIVNSPFYDGMIGYYAIKDLAVRAGCTSFVNDWVSPSDYFLPSGFSFSKPAIRWDSSKMIFDCIMEVVRRFEAFVYFDELGRYHIAKLPGGLFSEPTDISAYFTTSPFEADTQFLVGEKTLDISYESTVNLISIMSLERDTRNAIFYNRPARGSENHLLYKRVYLKNEAALGEIEVVRGWAEDLALRVFCPILKIRFQCVGNSTTVLPLSFVMVDGQPFRVMSYKRSYKADTNDFTSSYECEWLGGGC